MLETNRLKSPRDREQMAATIQQIAQDFEGEDLLTEEGDEQLLFDEPPERPPFPIIVFAIALVVDFFQVILNLLVITSILTIFLQLIMEIILMYWGWGKVSGKWWKKRVMRRFWKKYVVKGVFEMIPFINILPVNTIFVLMAHYDDTEAVRILNQILEAYRDSAFMKV